MHLLVGILQTYMTALGQSDYATVEGLFAPDGRVLSPFLGEMPAGPFFDRLAGASTKNVITPIDIVVSATGSTQISQRPAAEKAAPVEQPVPAPR